jgi:hypothetical protein
MLSNNNYSVSRQFLYDLIGIMPEIMETSY